jgi:hypothetical protein
MCCITLTALGAMATTELTRNVNYEVRTPWLPRDQHELRMNWVAVTDENGKHQLRMHWDVAKDD